MAIVCKARQPWSYTIQCNTRLVAAQGSEAELLSCFQLIVMISATQTVTKCDTNSQMHLWSQTKHMQTIKKLDYLIWYSSYFTDI